MNEYETFLFVTGVIINTKLRKTRNRLFIPEKKEKKRKEESVHLPSDIYSWHVHDARYGCPRFLKKHPLDARQVFARWALRGWRVCC